MEGASENHPLLERMGEDWATEELEQLLGRLEAVAPQRLEGKARDFRALRDWDRWSDLRSELLLADWITSRGLQVEFGDPRRPNPDIVVPGLGVGIEVTRRARGGTRELRRAIMAGTAGLKPRPRVTVHVSAQVLSIRKGVLEQITHEVASAAQAGQPRISAVLRPAHDDQPAATAQIYLNRGRSVVPTIALLPAAANLTVTMINIENVADACLRNKQKIAQGAAMPSLLMIDATELAPAVWLRSPQAWSHRLASLITPQDTFAGVGLVAAALGSEPRVAVGLGPNSIEGRTRIHEWVTRMGIPIG